MKRLFITLIILMFLVGCVTTFPAQDIVVEFYHPTYGLIPGFIEKGALDEDWHGEGWVTAEEWEGLMQEQSGQSEQFEQPGQEI